MRLLSVLAVTLGVVGEPIAATDGGTPGGTPPKLGGPPGEARIVKRAALPVGPVRGLSGLTRDGTGRLWAVAERDRTLIQFSLGGVGTESSRVPIRGIPAGLDTESIAWVREGLFALGTESQRPGRSEDRLLFARVGAGGAEVVDTWVLPYERWGVRPRGNEGIEALCVAGSTLVVGVESVIDEGDKRYAPFFRTPVDHPAWARFRLRLTTKTGKLSAFECRVDGAGLWVVGIERHYGVGRILGFRVPFGGQGGEVAPEVLFDFADHLPRVPNLEGLAWGQPGELVVVVDNDTGGVTGPHEVFVVESGRF